MAEKCKRLAQVQNLHHSGDKRRWLLAGRLRRLLTVTPSSVAQVTKLSNVNLDVLFCEL